MLTQICIHYSSGIGIVNFAYAKSYSISWEYVTSERSKRELTKVASATKQVTERVRENNIHIHIVFIDRYTI